MAIKVADRVKETTSTTGTGVLTLGGAFDGFQSFSGTLSDGEKTYYCIQNSTQFEVGRGLYGTGQLVRQSIFSSSSSNNLIDIGSQSEVFIGYPASTSAFQNEFGEVELGVSGIKFNDGTLLNTASAITVAGTPTQVLFFGADTNYKGISTFTYNSGEDFLSVGNISAVSGFIETSGGTHPHIRFAGSSTSAPINLNVRATGTGLSALTFDGNEGRLFTIEDNLSTGIIFSISDISGLSLIQADASGDVKLINGGRYVGIAHDSPAHALDVSGVGSFSSGVVSSGLITAATGIALHATTPATTTNKLYNVGGSLYFNGAAVDANTTYTAGTGLTLVGTTFNTAGTGHFEKLGIGTDDPDYTLDVAGNIGLNEYLYHNGDTNTYIRFRGDQIDLVAGNLTMLTLDEAGTDMVTVNIGGNDIDFQVEGENDANLIRTDAANDRVGIGTSTPSYLLDVAGTGNFNAVFSSGVIKAATGVTLELNTPAITTNKLYNVGGVLHFNGSGVNSDGGGSASIPVATGALIGQNAADIVTVSGLTAFPVATGALIGQNVADIVTVSGLTAFPTATGALIGQNVADIVTVSGLTAFPVATGALIGQNVADIVTVSGLTTLPVATGALIGQNATDIVTVSGIAAASGDNLTVADDIALGGRIYFEADEGTWVESDGTDRLRFVVGGNQMLLLDEDDDRVNIGFGNKLAVGYGNNTSPVHTLDVDGVARFTDTLLASGVSSTGLITAATGVELHVITPETTTNKLYNVGGVLYFNGSGVNSDTGGGGGGDITSVTAGTGLVGGGSSGAVTLNMSGINTDAIENSAVTVAKMANLADMKALGNVSGGAAAPAAVAILDEDNMASDSATSLATQQSIKAYADSVGFPVASGALVAQNKTDIATVSGELGVPVATGALIAQNTTDVGTVSGLLRTAGTGLVLVGSELNMSGINTDAIENSAVTVAKMANLADMKALGNVSGGAAAPAAVAILDEDAMGSNSATSLATQQSIKAYADSVGFPTASGALLAQNEADIATVSGELGVPVATGALIAQNTTDIATVSGELGVPVATGALIGQNVTDIGTVSGLLRTAGTGLTLIGDELNMFGTGALTQLDITQSTAAAIPLKVQGASSQSANLQEWQDSSDNVAASMDVAGNFAVSGNIDASGSINVIGEINVSDNDRAGNGGSVRFGNNAYLAASADNEIYLGVSNQEYLSLMTDRYSLRKGNKYAWSSNNAPNSAYDTALERVSAGIIAPIDGDDDYGKLYVDAVHTTGVFIASGAATVDLQTATDVGLTVQGAASQSANLQEWQDSNENAAATMDAQGNFAVSGTIDASGDITTEGFVNADRLLGLSSLNLYNKSGGAGRIQIGNSDTVFYQTARFQDEIRPDVDNASDALCGTSSKRWAESHVMTGVFYSGIELIQGTVAPTTTTNKLYNVGGVLYFNGSGVNSDDSGGGGGAGDITAVVAGTGLSGGATTGSATLNMSGIVNSQINETISVANGGTNATSFADKAVIITQDSGDDTLAAVAMDGNGELLIGGTSGPAVATLTQGSNMTITNANGSITLAAAGGGGSPSDENLKKNIKKLEIPDAMEKLEKLDIVEFDWAEKAKELFAKEGHDFGLIAQDVEKIMPELISEFNNYKIIEYYKISVLLIDAVKELKSEIEDLKQEISKLKDEE